ncbi:MAG: hypothetical protein EOO29_57430 [Comamonadaceae bacterium]|nr:MAG: hypothetical protein EOO29_57430 [Comamonadaceae bacterium]
MARRRLAQIGEHAAFKIDERADDVESEYLEITQCHGATPESGVTYIATSPAQKGKTIWLQKKMMLIGCSLDGPHCNA